MQDIVRRIKKAGKITSTADWQINRLRILGNSSEDIEKMLKETLDASYPQMFELYDKVIDWEYVRNKDVYEQINAEFIPYEENEELQQITNVLIQQTDADLQNITQSLGFYLDYGGGKPVLTPLAEVYQKYLDAACMDIVSGAFDYNSVIRRVVSQLTNSGLRQIDYASGRANRVDVAARRAVMTGITQLTGYISNMNAEKLGTEYYEVAWHAGARPTHAVWQGKVWSKKQLITVCGLGTVTGLEGVNCYHERYPFIPGISERNWTDEWLEEQNRKENTPKEFNGKEYTLYEAKQRQRQMETAMRAQRGKVQLLKDGDADPDDVMLARAKYQGQLNEYSRFSRKMGLKEERERIYYDMRGHIATNTKRQNAKYTPDMIRNATKDAKQYDRYKSIIGDGVENLADFRQMKYNDPKEFSLLADYTNSVKNGMISPLSGFRNYKTLYEMVEKDIVGLKTSTGIKMTGQSKHFMERVIGTKEDPKTHRPRSGVSIEDIQDALLNGTPRIRERDPNSIKYETDKCIVSVNPKTGILIQCNPR
nr:MAG TPA: minor capsid protein [Caudoviricetes sp.]